MPSIVRLGLLLTAITLVVAQGDSGFQAQNFTNTTRYQNFSKPIPVPHYVRPDILESQKTALDIEDSQVVSQSISQTSSEVLDTKASTSQIFNSQAPESCSALVVTSIVTETDYAATTTEHVAETTIYDYIKTIYESVQTLYAYTTLPASTVTEYILRETKTYTTTTHGYSGNPLTVTEYIVVESTVTSDGSYPTITSIGGNIDNESQTLSSGSTSSATTTSGIYGNSTSRYNGTAFSSVLLPYSTGITNSSVLAIKNITATVPFSTGISNVTVSVTKASANSTVALNIITSTTGPVTPTPTLGVCEINSDAISVLKEVSTVTGFCQQYLQMSTLSFTITSTSIPPRINSSVTVTKTAAETSITTEIDTTLTISTTAIETSVPIVTFTSSATITLVPRSQPVTAGNSNSIEVPEELARYDADSISAACSCLSVPVPSTTSTTTTTLLAQTSTLTANVTVVPTTIITAISTTSTTLVETSTTTLDTVTVTEVLTSTATPTAISQFYIRINAAGDAADGQCALWESLQGNVLEFTGTSTPKPTPLLWTYDPDTKYLMSGGLIAGGPSPSVCRPATCVGTLIFVRGYAASSFTSSSNVQPLICDFDGTEGGTLSCSITHSSVAVFQYMFLQTQQFSTTGTDAVLNGRRALFLETTGSSSSYSLQAYSSLDSCA